MLDDSIVSEVKDGWPEVKDRMIRGTMQPCMLVYVHPKTSRIDTRNAPKHTSVNREMYNKIKIRTEELNLQNLEMEHYKE